MVLRLLTITLSFKYPQRKLPGAVKSGKRRGQVKSLSNAIEICLIALRYVDMQDKINNAVILNLVRNLTPPKPKQLI